MDKITYKSIKKIPEVNAYIEQGNRVLGILGYTEHSRGHAVKVAETAGDILEKLGYNEHTVELAQIAGYMHDMGNCVNRVDHAHSSALMAFQVLREWKVPDEDIAAIVSAIGQHDEKTGTAVDAVSAALILADKTDVRRNRVRNPIKETFDIHDRVNYAAVASSLQVNVEKKDGYELEMDLPGFKKDEITAELKDGYMTISAAKGLDQDEQEKDTGRYLRRERYAGACQRTFYVGEDVTEEDIKAEFKHGILKLFIPKKEAKPAEPEKKFISIEG